MLPAITGIILLSKPIVLLISGPEYAEDSSSLAILGVALFLCMAAWFWGQCVLVPMKMENEVFKVTLFSAVLNLVLNLVLIPKWRENAAAYTTLLAEGCAYLWSMYRGRKFSGITGVGKTFFKSTIGCMGIMLVAVLFQNVIHATVPYVLTTIVTSVIVYGAIEILLKNEALFSFLREIKGRWSAKAS